MGEDLICWRARIGTYCHRVGGTASKGFRPSRHGRSTPTKESNEERSRSTQTFGESGSWEFCTSLAFRLCLLLLLVTSMSVELNPGPRHQLPTHHLSSGSQEVTPMRWQQSDLRTRPLNTTGCDIRKYRQKMGHIDTDDLESWGMDRVKDSFQSGVDAIVRLVEYKPLRRPVTVTDVQSVTAHVQYVVEQAYGNMKDASEKALLLNDELSKRIEGLKCKQGEKERKKRETEHQIKQLRAEITERKSQIGNLQNDLDTAKREYRNAQSSLGEARKQLEDKKRDQKICAGVGVGISVIPFVGWVAGPTLLAISFTALEKNIDAAKDMCNRASSNMDRQQERVQHKLEEIQRFQEQLDDVKSETKKLNVRIRQLKDEIDGLRSRYTAQSIISEKLKECASFISVAADRAEVLSDQVKFLCNLQAMLIPLRELVQQLDLSGSSQHSLHYVNEIIDQFVTKLNMIAEADSSWKRERALDVRKGHKVLKKTRKRKRVVEDVVAVGETSDHLYTSSKIQEERGIMLSTHAGWEDCLVPAPMTIAFLGELMLISTCEDFPLNTIPPKGGFKLLQCPKSFRASILQVSNEGWKAFNTANRSMDQIRIYVNTLPVHLKSAFDKLISASNEENAQFLPQSLKCVKNVAEKCSRDARRTKDGFVSVMNILSELLEACVVSKSHRERKLQDTRIRYDVMEGEKKDIEEEQQFINEQKEHLLESIKKAEEQSEKAMTSLPSGLEVTGLAVGDGVSTVVNGVSTVVGGVSHFCQKAMTGFQTFRKRRRLYKPDVNDNDKDDKELELDKELDEPSRKAYKEVSALHKIVNTLYVTFVKEDPLKLNKSKVENSTEMTRCDMQVKRIVDRLKAIKVQHCKVKEEVNHLATRTKSICARLSEIKRSISGTNQREEKKIASEIISLKNLTAEMASKGQSLTKSSAPLRKSWLSYDIAAGGGVSTSINNAKMKAEESCRILKNAQEKYDKSSDGLKDVNELLSKLLGEMAELDLEKIDYEQIIAILNRGLVAIGELKMQWGKILDFFQKITNMIDCSLNTNLEKFLDMSEKARKPAQEGNNLTPLKTWKRDMLYQEITHISEFVWFVSLITESYSEISAQHIMPRLNGLQKLLGFDRNEDEAVVERRALMQRTLQTECTDAQIQIKYLIERKRGEYLRLVHRQSAEFQFALDQSILADPREKKQINTDANAIETDACQIEDFI